MTAAKYGRIEVMASGTVRRNVWDDFTVSPSGMVTVQREGDEK